MNLSSASKFSGFCTLLALSACATLPARERGFDPALCNKHASYEAGFNDGEEGRAMGSDYAYRCREDLRAQAQEGYREGYAGGRKRLDERVKEMNAQNRPQTQPLTTATPVPVSTNSGTQININFGQQGAAAPTANPKAWYCTSEAFMQNFQAFGPTEIEARQATQQACQQKYHAMHCKEVHCQPNR